MGTKADRDSGIKDFVGNLLESQGLDLYEKWFARLKEANPDKEKITDFEVRDEMLAEITDLVIQGNSLILSKKDKSLVEELLNQFLKKAHLLQ